MIKRAIVFVIIAIAVNSNSQSYISLSTQGINFGIIKNRIDYGIGVDFRAQLNSYHNETVLKNISGNDTIYLNNSKTTIFTAGPEISIGYYFSEKKIRPFVQAYSEILFPISSHYEVDNNKNGYFKDMEATGGLIGGIEYVIDNKISIGSGIGPYLAYDKSENSVNLGDKSTTNYLNLWITSNFHFRYYF